MTKILGGRRVQPAAFVLMCAAWLEAFTLLPIGSWHADYHVDTGTVAALIVHGAGTLGALIGVAFAVAWWRGSTRLLDRALQASAVLWLWAAIVGVLQDAAVGRIVFALLWAILAIGSAWLEEAD